MTMRTSKRYERERKAALKRLAKNPVGPNELAAIAARHAAKIAERKKHA